eukprot:4270648-Amphidinium_carterae.2
MAAYKEGADLEPDHDGMVWSKDLVADCLNKKDAPSTVAAVLCIRNLRHAVYHRLRCYPRTKDNAKWYKFCGNEPRGKSVVAVDVAVAAVAVVVC